LCDFSVVETPSTINNSRRSSRGGRDTTTTTSSTTADGSSLVDGEAAEVAEVEDALSASQAADFLSLTMLMMVNQRRQWQQKREVIGVEACLSTESLYSANDIKRYVADWHQFPVM
jgi:hypothetical protein